MRNPVPSPSADASAEAVAVAPTAKVPSPVPAPPALLRLRVTSDPADLSKVRHAVEAYAEAAGFGAEAVAEVGLVVNEAMANVIRHAYQNRPGQPIEVEADPVAPTGDATTASNPPPPPGDDLQLRIRIRDWGIGVDPETAPKRGYIPGEPGGLGLVCLKQIMDRIEYAPQPDGGMLLTMLKKRA